MAIVVKLTGDTGDLEKALKNAVKGVEDLGNKADDAGGKTGKLGDALGGMGKVAAVAGGGAVAAVGAVGAAAWNVASDFEGAVRDMQTSLGIPKEEAEELGEVVKGVFGNNFGADMTDAASVVSVAFQTMGDVGNEALQSATENAFRLRDAFGIDTTESLNTVQTLMKNFGITSDEAFDLLTSAQQAGLNGSGDMLETINEYSTQIKNLGGDHNDLFSIMKSGYQAGVLGTDKAADAAKEFGIRIVDGSKTTHDALQGLGIDTDALFQGFQDGSVTGIDAMEQVLEKLRGMDDPVAQTAAGVALFGTQWEDMGASAMLGLTTTGDALSAAGGATAALDAQYAGLGDRMGGVWRQIQMAILPVGMAIMDGVVVAMDTLLPKAQAFAEFASAEMVPVLAAVASFITTEVVPAIAAFAGFFEAEVLPKVQAFLDWLGPKLEELGGWVEKQFGKFKVYYETDIKPALDNIITGVEAVIGFIAEHWPEIEAVVRPIMEAVRTLVETNVQIIMKVLGILIDLIGGDFSGAWEKAKEIVRLAADGMKEIISLMIESVVELVKGFGPLILEGLGNLGELLYEAGKDLIRGLIQGVQDMAGEAVNAVKGVAGDMVSGAKDKLKIWSPSQVFAGLGEEIPAGLAQGIKEGSPEALEGMRAWINDLTNDARDAFWLANAGMAKDLAAGGLFVNEDGSVSATGAGVSSGFTGWLETKGVSMDAPVAPPPPSGNERSGGLPTPTSPTLGGQGVTSSGGGAPTKASGGGGGKMDEALAALLEEQQKTNRLLSKVIDVLGQPMALDFMRSGDPKAFAAMLAPFMADAMAQLYRRQWSPI